MESNKKKRIARELGLVAKELMAAGKTDLDVKKIELEFDNLVKVIGLKENYKYFTIYLKFETYPKFRIYGAIHYTANTLDISEARELANEVTDATRKMQQVLIMFKKKYPDVQIVKYPYPA